MFMTTMVVNVVITINDTFRVLPDCAFQNVTVLLINSTDILPDRDGIPSGIVVLTLHRHDTTPYGYLQRTDWAQALWNIHGM